jgi:outer membrane protein TolC
MKNRMAWMAVGLVTAAVAANGAEAPSLDDCIKAALDSNPGVAAAGQQLEAARAALGQAESAYYPVLSAGGGYTRTDSPAQAFMMQINQRQLDMRSPDFDPNHPGDTGDVRGSVLAKYRLYDGGRREAERRAAASGIEAAGAQKDVVFNELVHAVTRAYYAVLQADAFAGVQEETVCSLEENLRVANEKFKAGGAVKTDVLQLEVQMAEARENLIRARHARELAVAALRTAMGRDMPGTEELKAARAADRIPEPPAADVAAVDGRPEMRALQARSRALEQAVERARREYRPTVSAFGSLDWDSEDLGGFERGYTAGVMAEWDFFDGQRRSETVRRAKAEWEAARAEEQRARDGLVFEFRQAGVQAKEARERIDVARKAVASADEALRLTQERYRQGAADVTELMGAQTGLTAVRNRCVAAWYDYLVALSNLERVQGRRAQAFTTAH